MKPIVDERPDSLSLRPNSAPPCDQHRPRFGSQRWFGELMTAVVVLAALAVVVVGAWLGL